MIYAYDCEFLEDGRTIELISIGIVAEDGREFYAVNSDAPWGRIARHEWLREHVVPHLPVQLVRQVKGVARGVNRERPAINADLQDARVRPKWVIANEVRDFLLTDSAPELWADYGAYDHVALAQLYGRMIDLPEGLPMWTHELQQAIEMTDPVQLPEQDAGHHDALADARHVMACLRAFGIAPRGDHR